MRIWIDATDMRSQLRVFGMSLLERQLQAISRAELGRPEVCVVLPKDTPTPRLPHLGRLAVRWERTTGSVQDRLAAAVARADGEALIATEGHAIIDARLLDHVAQRPGSYAAVGGEGEARTAVLRLEHEVPTEPMPQDRLTALAQHYLASGTLSELSLAELPSYIPKLRRDLPVYLFGVTDSTSRDAAERFLFWSNYKGSTDFFTKYVYPPLVWLMVRPLARWRVHPNSVTLVSIVLTLAAIPLFGLGYWVSGFVCAYAMSVLDSVDGKLARLTFRSSRLGDWLDHGLDIVHPPLWYAAWAWGLSQADPDSAVFQAAVWMTGVYILDRIVAGVFSWRHGRSIHGYTRLDEIMRTCISRRNINLPLFMVGLLVGLAVPVFYLIVAWQVASFVFHTDRLIRFWNARPTSPPAELAVKKRG